MRAASDASGFELADDDMFGEFGAKRVRGCAPDTQSETRAITDWLT